MACEQCREYREVIRAQGEFIQKIKRDIKDFTTTDAQFLMGKRAIADRGLRRLGG